MQLLFKKVKGRFFAFCNAVENSLSPALITNFQKAALSEILISSFLTGVTGA